jgi:hypothetical protein
MALDLSSSAVIMTYHNPGRIISLATLVPRKGFSVVKPGIQTVLNLAREHAVIRVDLLGADSSHCSALTIAKLFSRHSFERRAEAKTIVMVLPSHETSAVIRFQC